MSLLPLEILVTIQYRVYPLSMGICPRLPLKPQFCIIPTNELIIFCNFIIALLLALGSFDAVRILKLSQTRFFVKIVGTKKMHV